MNSRQSERGIQGVSTARTSGVRSATSEGGEEFDPAGDDSLLNGEGEQVVGTAHFPITSRPLKLFPKPYSWLHCGAVS
jgi:hypothetical protein